MKKFMLVVIGLFTLAFSASCTRAVNQKMSFQLQLPSDLGAHKVGSMTISPSDLNHLIINVTGPGISNPVYFSWDSNDGANTPPSNFTLDVPQGSDRLVQVLAVYKDGGNQAFYYGDIGSLSTQSANTSVTITVASISTTVGEGQIAGRYINSMSGTGPTGRITTKYTPPGRPAMTIETSEIFGGFFRVFALEGAYLDYVLDSGENLFEGPVDVDTPYLLDFATQVYMPDYYQSHGSGTYELRKESLLVLGWFAPTAIASTVLASKSVCLPDLPASPEIPYAYIDDSGSDIPIEWDLDAFNQAGIGVNESEDTDFLCAPGSGARFVDFLSVDHMSLGNHDQPLAFKGPYQLKTINDPYSGARREVLDVHYSSTNGLRLKWDYLPGVITSGGVSRIDGSDIFWRANINPSNGGDGDEEYRTDGGYNCAALGSYGFQLLHSNAADVADRFEDELISSLPTGFDGAFNGGRLDLVMCPYTNTAAGKKYYQAGASYHSHSGGTPATEFQLVKLSGDIDPNYNAYNYTCTPFLLRGLDGYIANLDIYFTLDTEIEVFDDSDCAMPISGSVSYLPYFGDGYILYVKRAYSGSAIQVMTISDNLGEMADLDVNFNFDDIGTPTEQALVLAPTTVKKHSCYPVSVIMRDASNSSMMLPMGSTDDKVFEWPTVSGLGFYTDPDCSTTLSPAENTLFTNQALTTTTGVFFKYTGVSSTLNMAPTIISGTSVTIVGGSSIAVSNPGTPAQISMQLPMSIPSATCQSFNLTLYDNSGFYSPATATFNVNFTADGSGQFYPPDSGTCTCANTATTTISFPSGSTSVQACYTNPNSELENITASGTHSGKSLSFTMEVDNYL